MDIWISSDEKCSRTERDLYLHPAFTFLFGSFGSGGSGCMPLKLTPSTPLSSDALQLKQRQTLSSRDRPTRLIASWEFQV